MQEREGTGLERGPRELGEKTGQGYKMGDRHLIF